MYRPACHSICKPIVSALQGNYTRDKSGCGRVFHLRAMIIADMILFCYRQFSLVWFCRFFFFFFFELEELCGLTDWPDLWKAQGSHDLGLGFGVHEARSVESSFNQLGGEWFWKWSLLVNSRGLNLGSGFLPRFLRPLHLIRWVFEVFRDIIRQRFLLGVFIHSLSRHTSIVISLSNRQIVRVFAGSRYARPERICLLFWDWGHCYVRRQCCLLRLEDVSDWMF